MPTAFSGTATEPAHEVADAMTSTDQPLVKRTHLDPSFVDLLTPSTQNTCLDGGRIMRPDACKKASLVGT